MLPLRKTNKGEFTKLGMVEIGAQLPYPVQRDSSEARAKLQPAEEPICEVSDPTPRAVRHVVQPDADRGVADRQGKGARDVQVRAEDCHSR